jgi:hypothetical protein
MMILRTIVALAVLVNGVVHLDLWWNDGFKDISVIGPLFLLNAVAAAVIAVAVMSWRHWLPVLAAVGFGAATFTAFTISATVGLFGVHERWSGGPIITSLVSEVVAVLVGLVVLALEWRRARSGHEAHDLLAGPRPHVH